MNHLYFVSACPESISMCLSEFLQSNITIAKIPIIIKNFGTVCDDRCKCDKGNFNTSMNPKYFLPAKF